MLNPIKITFNTSLSIEESKKLILSCFNNMNAKVVSQNPNQLTAKLGSGIKFRLLGILIAGIQAFPRKIITLIDDSNNETEINIEVIDDFGFGTRIGISKKIINLMESDALKIKKSFPS